MRSWLFISFVALTAVACRAPATAQTVQELAARCSPADPSQFSLDEQAAACSALIDSAKRAGKNPSLVYRSRGVVFGQKGDVQLAITDFSEAIRLDPKSAEAFYDRGIAYEQMRDHERAISDLGEAIRINSQYAEAYNNRCWIRAAFVSTNLDLARSDCDAAIRLSKSGSHFANRGLVDLKQSRFQDAWNDFDAAVNSASGGIANLYLYGRGIAALRLRRTTEGNADLATANASDPRIAANYEAFGIKP
jgi:tetratricopeptide (TPR) repeat protein